MLTSSLIDAGAAEKVLQDRRTAQFLVTNLGLEDNLELMKLLNDQAIKMGKAPLFEDQLNQTLTIGQSLSMIMNELAGSFEPILEFFRKLLSEMAQSKTFLNVMKGIIVVIAGVITLALGKLAIAGGLIVTLIAGATAIFSFLYARTAFLSSPDENYKGTNFTSGRASFFQERGPELFQPPRGSKIYSTPETMDMIGDREAAAYARGASRSSYSDAAIGEMARSQKETKNY